MLRGMSYGKQLKDAREALKLNQDQAAEAIGVSRVSIADWEAERAFPTKKHWPAIKAALGVELVLTVAEDREPYNPEDKYALISRYAVQVPAGSATEIEHEEVNGTFAYRRDWLAKRGLIVSQLSVVEAKGDSMYPTINDGDAVLVNHADKKLRNNEVYCFRTEDGPRFKRLVRQLDGKVRVVSDNPDKTKYPDEWLSPGSEAQLIGHVEHRSGSV